MAYSPSGVLREGSAASRVYGAPLGAPLSGMKWRNVA